MDNQAELRKRWKLFWKRMKGIPLSGPHPPVPQEFSLLRCGAKTRAGTPCKRSDLHISGRCKLHGGLATGPHSEEGKQKISQNARKNKPHDMPHVMLKNAKNNVQFPSEKHVEQPHVILVKPSIPTDVTLKNPTTGKAVITMEQNKFTLIAQQIKTELDTHSNASGRLQSLHKTYTDRQRGMKVQLVELLQAYAYGKATVDELIEVTNEINEIEAMLQHLPVDIVAARLKGKVESLCMEQKSNFNAEQSFSQRRKYFTFRDSLIAKGGYTTQEGEQLENLSSHVSGSHDEVFHLLRELYEYDMKNPPAMKQEKPFIFSRQLIERF